MPVESPSHLRGRSAIVTGAGRGIGRAIARRLAAAGANVAIAARTADQLAETQRCIEPRRAGGGRALAVVADVTRAEDVDRLVADTMATFGGVNILVNNAGTAPLATIEQMEPPTFDAILATNVRSVYLCCRAVWPHMSAAGGGIIVNISSMSSFDPFAGFAAYGAAKAFVNTYTRGLATEGRERGIRVYAVAPGAVDTVMLRSAFPNFPQAKMLAPDDVAEFVESLLAPACRHAGGQTLVVSNG